MKRAAAVDRLAAIVDRVERATMPVPVREVWAFGDVALGLDPIDRLDVYLTKDVLLDGDADAATAFEAEYGVKGIGTTVRASWAEATPDRVRTSDNGYAAPEKCLAAELLAAEFGPGVGTAGADDHGAPDADAPIHLEVCNASFDDNVTQRLKGALAREAYDEVLDPRGVQLWADGRRATETLAELREGSLAFPTFSAALSMLGVEEDRAAEVAEAVRAREDDTGRSVRGDVV